MCGSGEVATKFELQTFEYGIEPHTSTISCTVPVRACAACRFEFTDDAAEEARHDAVCRHLSVMTPREVESIRKRYGLSRSEFGRLTRIGEASLARWESGAVIQNAGYDQFLYLLTFPDNLQRLTDRGKHPSQVTPRADSTDRAARFRAIENIEVIATQATHWELRLPLT
jgi:DNA-binding transcriptional regulator YiaG